MSFLIHSIGVDFEFDERNSTAKDITVKIMALLIDDRLWPNCFNRPIKNASMVDVDDFLVKMKKTVSKGDGCNTETAETKAAATRTRSKSSIPASKPSLSIQSILSESKDSPQITNEIEMSTGSKYARSTCRTFSYFTRLFPFTCLLLVLMTTINPFFLILEFKPPVLKPFIISSKDLFNKRAREEKSTETETSKAPMILSPIVNPLTKKVRTDPSSISVPSESSQFTPLVAHC